MACPGNARRRRRCCAPAQPQLLRGVTRYSELLAYLLARRHSALSAARARRRGQSIRLSASVARSARTVTLDLLAMGRYGQA